MKRAGQSFVALAAVGAFLLTVYSLFAHQPNWPAVSASYGAAMLLGVIGAILIARSIGSPDALEFQTTPNQETNDHVDRGAVEEQLSRVVGRLQDMNTNSETIDVQEVGPLIDSQLADDMSRLHRATPILSQCLDGGSLSDFAVLLDTGQRLLDQARSAAAMGNAEEVWDSLSVAEQRMAEAFVLLRHDRGNTDHPSHN